MVASGNKRPPRQPLTPEEVKDLVKLKQLRQLVKTEKFKTTKKYKYLNVFNIICIVIYTEMIFSFLSAGFYSPHYIKTLTPYYDDKIIADKRVLNSLAIRTVDDVIYEFSIRDTCTLPPLYSKFNVGKDWLFQKDIKIKLEGKEKEYYISRSFPLLFISLLLGIVSFVLYGYNLNQNSYSLNAISTINSLSLLYFILL